MALATPSAAAARRDTTPPTVSITKPANGSRVWGTTQIAASAKDNRGVKRVDFYVDGVLKGSDSTSPYVYAWDTKPLAELSSHTLSARAYDTSNNSATSTSVSVVVSRRIPLGSAVNTNFLGSAVYTSTFLNNFQSLTPEWEMKMNVTEPQQGVFDFSLGDQLVSFAEQNNKSVRGHVLVWGNGPLPGWLTSQSWAGRQSELRDVLKNHVQAMVSHYGSRVPVWDVVNEAFNSDGTWRSNIWYDNLGPSYVEDAFRWAHEANPSAKLYYNDVQIERNNAHSDAVYNLLKDFKDPNRAGGLVPVDGVGMQSHTGTLSTITTSELQGNMQRFAALGLDIELTEMDVKTSGTIGTTDQKLQKQADIYGIYSSSCQQIVACKRFTVWGVSDAVSWLGSAEMPLLFDVNYNPKPAYFRVADNLALSAGPP